MRKRDERKMKRINDLPVIRRVYRKWLLQAHFNWSDMSHDIKHLHHSIVPDENCQRCCHQLDYLNDHSESVRACTRIGISQTSDGNSETWLYDVVCPVCNKYQSREVTVDAF